MNEFAGIFAISCVAVLAPLLVRLPAFAFMPVVGLELILGVLIGPSVMGLVTNDNTIKFLAEFGLVFLFFQAGLESKQDEIGRAELRLGAFAWLVSFALAAGFVSVLYLFGHGPLAAARRPHFADDGVRRADPHFAADRRTAQQFRPACPGTRGDRRTRAVAVGLDLLGGGKASTPSGVLEHRLLRAGLRRHHFAFDAAVQWFFRETGALARTRRRTAAVANFPARAARVRFSRRQLRHGGRRRRLCRRHGGRRVLFRMRRAGARKPAHVDRFGFFHPPVLHRERRGVRSAGARVESPRISAAFCFSPWPSCSFASRRSAFTKTCSRKAICPLSRCFLRRHCRSSWRSPILAGKPAR